MSSKASSSLKELKGLREAVLAEEKARTQALLQNLPEPPSMFRTPEPVPEPVADPAVEQIEENEPALAEPLPPPPQAPPPSPKPPAPRPSPPPVNRATANKEPALIIPLTPRIQERLTRHVDGARWGPAELVMEVLRVALHHGYPEVQCGDELIAKLGTYRTYERNPLEAVLRIVSGQGVFNITVRPQNPDYQHWLSYFVEQKAPNAEQSAQQVCLFSLQSYLESVEDFKPQDWVKSISPDSFSVALSP
ncbi:MAG: hypothetical protein FJ398_01445 [Verrucomicrobia bacterium]|nr:hypothetical protein [Verrucomicrobiota bacterium]